MRFQLLLVGLATIVCLAVGVSRWQAKLYSAQAFDRAERDGRWAIVTGDYAGLHATSRHDGTEPLSGFSNVQANQAWDVSPDLRRVALTDNYSYTGNPGLKVYAARRSDPIAEAAPAAGATFYCPLFDDDGSLLFLETRGTSGALRRLDVPKHDSANATSRVSNVKTATPLRYDDCPERSADGEWLAWFGSDGQIHVARWSSGGFLASHQTFAGTEFAFSDDATKLATRSGADIRIVDVTSGASRVLTSDLTYGTLVDFSPDGVWLAVLTSQSFSGRGMVALRVSDAEVIRIPTRSSYYYAQPGQAVARWVAKP